MTPKRKRRGCRIIGSIRFTREWNGSYFSEGGRYVLVQRRVATAKQGPIWACHEVGGPPGEVKEGRLIETNGYLDSLVHVLKGKIQQRKLVLKDEPKP